MALVLGTNCGFVSSAPVYDPAETNGDDAGYAVAMKDSSPVGAVRVTEMGVWIDTAMGDTDICLGIYTHDSGNDKPDDLVDSTTFAKGTTAGWKTAVGLNFVISASTTYWVAFQFDNPGESVYTNYKGSGGDTEYKAGQTTLPADWGTSTGTVAWLFAVYAVWGAAAGTNSKINIGDAWKDIDAIKINIGDAWKDVSSAKINIGDAWKTVYGS